MNYNATKQYGSMVKEMASQIAQSNNIYNVSAELYEAYNESLYLISRLSLKELYDNYPNNQKVLSFVIDEYVIDDKVREVFLTKLFQNDDFEIEFIKRDIGGAYNFLCSTQTLLQAIAITAHPSQYKEGQLTTALEKVIRPAIEPSIKNVENFGFAFNSLAAKDALRAAEEQTEQEELQKTDEPKHNNQEELKSIKPKYIIGNLQLLMNVYNYLIETEVLDKEYTSPQDFINAIENANVSSISPKLQDNFKCTLNQLKECIKSEKRKWLREICSSINLTPQQASKNGTNLGKWYEDLQKLVSKKSK